MNPLLADRVAIVTGGASGLGRATVELFVEQGARVVIADVSAEAGEALAAALGDNAVFKRTDVADPPHELARRDLDLHPRERRADAAMDADAERDVTAEIAAIQIEIARAFELAVVVVAGCVQHQQMCAGRQFLAAEFDFAEALGIGEDDFGSRGHGGGLDAGAMEAALRLVATDVGDDDALCAGLPALTHDFGDEVGVGVGGLLWGCGPRRCWA